MCSAKLGLLTKRASLISPRQACQRYRRFTPTAHFPSDVLFKFERVQENWSIPSVPSSWAKYYLRI